MQSWVEGANWEGGSKFGEGDEGIVGCDFSIIVVNLLRKM